MKQDILEAVNGSILDICVHPLVEDGTFDVQNTEHMFLLMESLIEKNFDDTTVSEVVKALRHEGKHPERQAYNKEGWLVTFPSKEYRDAALKKGTHAIADPTHGKGGMNLYYKKKGKQKRVTQQATSQTDPNAIKKQAPADGSQASTPDSTSSDLPPATEPTAAAASAPEKTAPAASASSEPSAEDPASAQSEPTAASATEPATKGANAPQGAATAAPAPQAAPKEPAAPVVQPKVDITVQFAKSKNWSSTPYGEWRDSSGSVVAVVSLSGEVAPIKSNDRDELKLFAEKQG
jgi:hypothetical protein